MWYDVPITLEEYVKKHTLEELFENTEAAPDKATQQLIYDWYFDFPICTDDEEKFARYFKRRVNLVYKRYKDQLRVMTVSGNMDPFIDHYLEVLGSVERTGQTTSNTKSDMNGSATASTSNTGDSHSVRTPELTSETKDSHSSQSSTTRTDDLESNSKSNGFGIAYPEANMGEIPATIDAVPSINYANSQQYELGKTTNTGTQSSDGTDSGSSTSTIKNTGKETATAHSEGASNSKSDNTTSATGSTSGSSSEKANDARQEKGRSQAVQDMLPQAIRAIRGCNAITWLIEELRVCFDCYG